MDFILNILYRVLKRSMSGLASGCGIYALFEAKDNARFAPSVIEKIIQSSPLTISNAFPNPTGRRHLPPDSLLIGREPSRRR